MTVQRVIRSDVGNFIGLLFVKLGIRILAWKIQVAGNELCDCLSAKFSHFLLYCTHWIHGA